MDKTKYGATVRDRRQFLEDVLDKQLGYVQIRVKFYSIPESEATARTLRRYLHMVSAYTSYTVASTTGMTPHWSGTTMSYESIEAALAVPDDKYGLNKFVECIYIYASDYERFTAYYKAALDAALLLSEVTQTTVCYYVDDVEHSCINAPSVVDKAYKWLMETFSGDGTREANDEK